MFLTHHKIFPFDLYYILFSCPAQYFFYLITKITLHNASHPDEHVCFTIPRDIFLYLRRFTLYFPNSSQQQFTSLYLHPHIYEIICNISLSYFISLLALSLPPFYFVCTVNIYFWRYHYFILVLAPPPIFLLCPLGQLLHDLSCTTHTLSCTILLCILT